MMKSLRATLCVTAVFLALAGCSNRLFDALTLLRMKISDGGPGALDTSFDPGTGVTWAPPPGTIRTIVVQDDGRILVGGLFDSYNGENHNKLARLTADGGLDSGFSPSFGATVYGVTTLPDGSILVGGAYVSAPPYLSRLFSSGSIDSSFMPDIGGGAVRGSIVLPEAKVLIYGDFATLSGVAHSCIGRLLDSTSGGTDSSFTAGFGSATTPTVAWVGRLSDGSLVAAGRFDNYAGLACNPHVARLTASGNLDAMFNSGGAGVTGPTPEVYAGALQTSAGDKILIGGIFTGYNWSTVNNLARLNADGTLDATFPVGGAGPNAPVRSIALQGDGKILIGGTFTTYNGVNCKGLARLNSDGSLDATFDTSTGIGTPGAVGVAAIVVQPDGRILIGGDFTTYDGTSRRGIARVWD